MVIGVQPVRVRCGYRLCLTKQRAVDPANDSGEMDGQQGRILKKGGLLASFKRVVGIEIPISTLT